MATALTRTYGWASDAGGSFPNLTASRMDGEDNEIVAALNQKVVISSTAPTVADGVTWVDTSLNPIVVKIYDATNTQWIGIANKISYLSTDGINDSPLDVAMENFIDGCWIYRVDGDNVGVGTGSVMINGKLRRNTTAITNVTYTPPTNLDWLDIWALADANATTFTASAVDSGVSPGGSSNPGTNGRLIASIKYIDGTSKIANYIQYRDGYSIGWGYMVGNNTASMNEAVTYGITYAGIPIVSVTVGSKVDAVPTTPTGSNNFGYATYYYPKDVTTTGFTMYLTKETGGSFASNRYYIYNWLARGTT